MAVEERKKWVTSIDDAKKQQQRTHGTKTIFRYTPSTIKSSERNGRYRKKNTHSSWTKWRMEKTPKWVISVGKCWIDLSCPSYSYWHANFSFRSIHLYMRQQRLVLFGTWAINSFESDVQQNVLYVLVCAFFFSTHSAAVFSLSLLIASCVLIHSVVSSPIPIILIHLISIQNIALTHHF